MKLIKFLLNFFPRPFLLKMSHALLPIIGVFFRGEGMRDPINGKNYRAFLPYGYGNQRTNALSPGTLSLERHRLLWLYLQNETDFFTAPLKVLHMAPEQCFLKRFKQLKNLDYTTADLYSPLADVKADILALPFEDEQFDVVLCNHVLEHIADDHKAMQELFRVMKPSGWGIFQVPMQEKRAKTYEDSSITTPEERKKHFKQYDHVRIYGLDYFDRLKAVGFEVEPLVYAEKFTSEQIKKWGLVAHEILPIVRKKG